MKMRTFKPGEIVEYEGRPYLYVGDSMNGVHAIIVDRTCSLKMSVAHSLLKKPYIQPWHEATHELEALSQLSADLFGEGI